jgi:nickel superoxide dismutase
MLHNLINLYDKCVGIDAASAHCDVPCKIYDPITAQIATLSTIRFMDLINELASEEKLSLADQAKLSRLVAEKEVHAEKVKHEVRGIWGDYFKQPQFEQFPNIHTLVHSIMLAGSACKQGIEREKGEVLLALVNEFAAAYWSTKNVETYMAKSPYPPEEMIVYPTLK